MIDRQRHDFKMRCAAAAKRYGAGAVDLHDAVDALQEHAVTSGLVAAIGQDHVQHIMAEAFRPYREQP